MRTTEVILSDGKPCSVRRLGVFDLDGVGPELPGPFRYTYELSNGQLVEDTYDVSARSKPPEHPGVPENEIVERGPQWHALLEYETYKAGIAYEYNVRLPQTVHYVREMSAFIVDTCLTEDDVSRIVTEDDYALVYEAAVVPQVTMELLAGSFKHTFSASYDEKEITDAIRGLSEGKGKLDTLRKWEHQAMAEYGFRTEREWGEIQLSERVRKVASIALPSLMEALQTEDQIKEMKRGK